VKAIKNAVHDGFISLENIFTLPGEKALCALRFKSEWPDVNIYGAESQEQALNRCPKAPFKYLHHGTISGYRSFVDCKNVVGRFQFINADFCGFPSETLFNQAETLIKRFGDTKCLFSVTHTIDRCDAPSTKFVHERTGLPIGEDAVNKLYGGLGTHHYSIAYRNSPTSPLMYMGIFRRESNGH
jgi:hypothetical protein